ncbi:MAG: hypothetical protein HY578_10160 [Nitrospinae bacterium]|nr:hypothetical protein [Nitrospinota bacterium]
MNDRIGMFYHEGHEEPLLIPPIKGRIGGVISILRALRELRVLRGNFVITI